MSLTIENIKPLIISQLPLKNRTGGVEVWTGQLKRFFKNAVIVGPPEGMPLSRFEHINAQRTVKAAIENYEPRDFDLVITSGMGGHTLSDIKLKRVNFFHGNWMGFRDHCYRIFDRRYISISVLKIPYEIKSAKNALNIPVSKFVADCLNKERIGRQVLIYNTVFTEYIKSTPEYALFVGRPTAEKGFGIFLHICRRNPRDRFTAVIPSGRKLAGIPENLEILYDIPNSDMRAVYGKASMLIMPSLFEGNSFVILEALACDVPVIGSNVGLLWELDDIPGRIVNGFELEEWSRAYRDMKDLGHGTSPKKFFLDHYSPSAINEQWERALEML